MINSILTAVIVYFFIGVLIVRFICAGRYLINIQVYTFSFAVSITACGLYYLVWVLLGLHNFKGVEGLFSPDSSTYYVEAVEIVKANFSNEVLNRVITDHYHELFLAIQMYIFGDHVLIPKIYQVLLFSIAVVLWISIARDILRQNKMVKYFFYLLVFCVPLLTYNAHVLKEISLFLATTVAIYGFTKYHFKKGHQFKYLLIALLGLIFMFLFRREFALIMFLSFVMGTFIGSGLSLKKKIGWGIVSAIGLIIIAFLPVFQQIGALAPLTEGGNFFIGRTDTGGRVSANVDAPTGGMLGFAIIIVTNPLLILPMFIYGIFQLFFHPPFLFTPNEMIERGELSYLTMGYYNILFTLMLPALYFGAKDLFKRFKGNPVFIALLIYFLFASLATIFGSDSYRRFKVSYFWPIAYLCISYGFVTFPVWKKKLPLIFVIFIGFLIAFFSIDFIGLVSV